MKLPIYLDYMATTPADERVVKKMLGCLTLEGHFGNPSSLHYYGHQAEEDIVWARNTIASVIHGDPAGITFTSGATESINLALKGATHFYQRQGKHIITTRTEHKAVLDTCDALRREGFSITYLPVQKNGLISLETLQKTLTEETILVSIGHVNNEIGVIQPIEEIGKVLRSKGILFHVDGAQSIGKVNIDVGKMNIDLLSLSAHKSYGPKGIGALYARQKPKLHLKALTHGGKQQRGLRAGTLPTHQIVGMAEAFRIAQAELDSKTELTRLLKLREVLWEGLKDLAGAEMNGDLSERVANNLHVTFHELKEPIDATFFEDLKGLALSKASACLSSEHEPSHVLKAIGLSDEASYRSLRFSLGRFTTEEEIQYAIDWVRGKFGSPHH